MEVYRRIKVDLDARASRKLWYIHVCLELDFLSSPTIRKLTLQAAAPENNTASGRETAEEAALRRSFLNAMVVGLLSLLNPDGERYDLFLCDTIEPWLPWHELRRPEQPQNSGIVKSLFKIKYDGHFSRNK